jgi:2-polyprenyl-3-methyl-5-hydroxy-6-metoxy-1,4-benzoquinol methylase
LSLAVNTPAGLRAALGGIDIYLFDQVLRGRIEPGCRIMDAGCGGGRNLVYFLQSGYDVSAIDADPVAIESVRALAARLAPDLAADRFRSESLAQSSFPNACADVVISSAVLHFATGDEDFRAMLAGSWRLVAPGGMFFARLASTIGIEADVRPLAPGSRRCRLPDSSDRYLVDASMLLGLTAEMGGQLLDPIKTTVVHNQRSMTTWVVAKPS